MFPQPLSAALLFQHSLKQAASQLLDLIDQESYSSSEKGLNKLVIAGILGGIKEKLQEKTSDDEHEDSL